MKLFNKLKSRSGQSLIMVIVVMAMLIIIAVSLADSSIQGLKISNLNRDADYAYFSADSAIEKCFNRIYLKLLDASYTVGTPYSTDKEFADKVVNNLQNDINTELSTPGSGLQNIKITDNSFNNAEINPFKFEVMKANLVGATMTVKIGVTVDAGIMGSYNQTQRKKVFASKDFNIIMPQEFKLRGPVYTIGDLMIRGTEIDPKNVLSVTGDVHVYGTSPEKITEPKQNYYGGIFIKNNALATINGNAYSRSFIRSGEDRNDGVADNSRLDITKDAITQGIQVFGNNDKIVVYRNAYTFDDVEMNGENSVIAINGNLMGLSNGGAFHDESSAIVSSAMIHHSSSVAAMKSRIIINGNVLINGGTFVVKADGSSDGQIEDASVAFDKTNVNPLYQGWNPITDGDYDNWLKTKGYKTTNFSDVRGFANIFQVWKTNLTNIEAWLSDIDLVRNNIDPNLIGENKFNLATDSSLLRDPVDPVPADILGYSSYSMAANDKIYYTNPASDPLWLQTIKKIGTFSDFLPDAIKEQDPTFVTDSDWNDLWTPAVTASSWSDYCIAIKNNFTKVIVKFLSEVDVFATRTTSSSIIKHGSLSSFNTLRIALNKVITSPSLSVTAVKHIFRKGSSDPLMDLPDTPSINTITEYQIPSTIDTLSGYDDAGTYFLFNNDADLTLVLDGGKVFNGIIFTTGKLIIKGGSTINGAIIAAGRGYETDSSTSLFATASAGEQIKTLIGQTFINAPIVKNSVDLANLNNGDYAAIICEGEGNLIKFPGTDGLSGRNDLISKLSNEGIELNGILN